MMTDSSVHTRADDAVLADEIGLFYGVYGEYRLRSTFQPIYERRGGALLPAAVEGSISPCRAGNTVAPADAFLGIDEAGLRFIDGLGRGLALRNHRHAGIEGLRLLLPCGPLPHDGGVAATLASIAVLAEEGLVDPRLLICDVTQAGEARSDDCVRLVGDLRAIGAAVAVTVGPDRSPPPLEIVRPDVVRIDAAWFASLSRWSATARLFVSAVSTFAQTGAGVLIPGIDDAARFAVAVKSGAHFFQGSHLAAFALAGTEVDGAPIRIADRLKEAPNVVPLFG